MGVMWTDPIGIARTELGGVPEPGNGAPALCPGQGEDPDTLVRPAHAADPGDMRGRLYESAGAAVRKPGFPPDRTSDRHAGERDVFGRAAGAPRASLPVPGDGECPGHGRTAPASRSEDAECRTALEGPMRRLAARVRWLAPDTDPRVPPHRRPSPDLS
jgi:hypothetical protein